MRSKRPHVFGRILAGTDGSARAEDAVARVADLASVTGAALDLVYVIDTSRPHDDAEVEPKAEVALQRAAEAIASTEGVPAITRVVAGDSAEALLEEAADSVADLICVGPDAGLLGGTVRIGRVAAHVLRHAPCSVLVGREASGIRRFAASTSRRYRSNTFIADLLTSRVITPRPSSPRAS
jgi:nucleotide-binding universal stress UspA family protein